jgi:hypothetical protein
MTDELEKAELFLKAGIILREMNDVAEHQAGVDPEAKDAFGKG